MAFLCFRRTLHTVSFHTTTKFCFCPSIPEAGTHRRNLSISNFASGKPRHKAAIKTLVKQNVMVSQQWCLCWCFWGIALHKNNQFRPNMVWIQCFFSLSKTCWRWHKADQRRVLCDQLVLPAGGLDRRE